MNHQPSHEDRKHPDPPERSTDERTTLLARFEAAGRDRAGSSPELLPDQLCRAVVDVLDVDGAALSVYVGADLAVAIGASDLNATTGQALQFTRRPPDQGVFAYPLSTQIRALRAPGRTRGPSFGRSLAASAGPVL